MLESEQSCAVSKDKWGPRYKWWGGGGWSGNAAFINASFALWLRIGNLSLHGESVNENGMVNVPSVLSPLPQMLNYKHIRKLFLSFPQFTKNNLGQYECQKFPQILPFGPKGIVSFTLKTVLLVKLNGKGEEPNAVLLEINFHVFEASYVHSDCFLFWT